MNCLNILDLSLPIVFTLLSFIVDVSLGFIDIFAVDFGISLFNNLTCNTIFI